MESAEFANGTNPTDIVADVRERLAGIGTVPSEQLVVGLWRPREEMCVVALAGEMDMSNAEELRRELAGRVPSGPYSLIVELSQLSFIDSTGIRAVAAVAGDVKAGGGTVVLAGPTQHVARVFEIVKLDELVAVAPSLEDAIVVAETIHSARLDG
jgi:anti-sigma B factor antagonist